MDYEKKYNEALSQAKFYYENCPTEPEKKKLEKLFPELRESEDERIRKGMIRFLESEQAEGMFTYEARQSWIAYLEKQKEKKPVGFPTTDEEVKEFLETHPKVEVPEKYKTPDFVFSKQDYSGLTDLERAIHRGFLVAGVENVPVTIIKQTAKECLAQMKPAEWSEEDERMRNQLIYDVEHHKKEGLISAKQNKATEALYNVIERCYDEKKIAWLKSLRPQPNWKPQKELLDALHTTAYLREMDFYGGLKDKLRKLDTQLRELM